MCKLNDKKKFAQWKGNQGTKDFLAELSNDLKIASSALDESKQGSTSGSFIHPMLAIHLATWISPAFGLAVIKWTCRYLSGDASLLHDVADRVDLVHGTKSLLTHTVVDKDERDAELAELHTQVAKHQVVVFTLQSQLRDATAKQTASSEQVDQLTVDYKLLRDASDASDNRASTSSHEIDRLTADLEQLGADSLLKLELLRDAEAKQAAFSEQVNQLTAELATLGVDSRVKTDRLTIEIRKRRRIEKVVKQNDATNDQTLAVHLMQTNLDEPPAVSGEQPNCNTMPARFLAMQGVNEATNGLEHKIAHALIKETLAAIAENIMKFQRAIGVSRACLVGCITTIIGEQALDNPRNHLTSNVFIVNLLCANIKRIHRLRHATHITLGSLYNYVRRANRWFRDRHMSAEFQLVQANDLANVLGYKQVARIPMLARFNPSDIRLHFPARA